MARRTAPFASAREIANAAAQDTADATTLAGTTTTLGRAVLTDLDETAVALGSGTAINCNAGTVFKKTISGSTTFTVANVPASGTVTSFLLELTNPSTNVTWWANLRWAGGQAPTLSTTGVDVLGFYTTDAGANWRGMVLGKGFA